MFTAFQHTSAEYFGSWYIGCGVSGVFIAAVTQSAMAVWVCTLIDCQLWENPPEAPTNRSTHWCQQTDSRLHVHYTLRLITQYPVELTEWKRAGIRPGTCVCDNNGLDLKERRSHGMHGGTTLRIKPARYITRPHMITTNGRRATVRGDWIHAPELLCNPLKGDPF